LASWCFCHARAPVSDRLAPSAGRVAIARSLRQVEYPYAFQPARRGAAQRFDLHALDVEFEEIDAGSPIESMVIIGTLVPCEGSYEMRWPISSVFSRWRNSRLPKLACAKATSVASLLDSMPLA